MKIPIFLQGGPNPLGHCALIMTVLPVESWTFRRDEVHTTGDQSDEIQRTEAGVDNQGSRVSRGTVA